MDETYLMWGARLFLLIIAILFIYIIFRKKNVKKYHKTYSSLFDMIFNSLTKSGKWKDKCKKKNKTEEKCRRIIERIYSAKFPSCRPDFLRSPVTGKNLELDCYNERLGIAIEYNGRQHYSYTPHFHKSKKNFYSQVHRDDWKRKRCKEMGIKLIEIPYWISPDKLEAYIKKELRKNKKLI